MKKILLMYDDFPLLTSAESSLKKVGFDVIGLSTEFSLSNKILAFNPDAVVAMGKTSKLNTLSVGRKLSEMGRWRGKAILLLYPGVRATAEDLAKMRIDVLQEGPLNAEQLVKALGSALDIDVQAMIEKLRQSFEGDSKSEASVPGSKPGAGSDLQNQQFTTISEAQKQLNQARTDSAQKAAKYAKLASSLVFDPNANISKAEARKRLKAMHPEMSEEKIIEQDDLRRAFTASLFKRK